MIARLKKINRTVRKYKKWLRIYLIRVRRVEAEIGAELAPC